MPKQYGREREITRSQEARNGGIFVEAIELQAETEKAVGLPHRGDQVDPIWLPKSQIDAMEAPDGRVFIYVPEWLARKKELGMVRKH